MGVLVVRFHLHIQYAIGAKVFGVYDKLFKKRVGGNFYIHIYLLTKIFPNYRFSADYLLFCAGHNFKCNICQTFIRLVDQWSRIYFEALQKNRCACA